MHNQLSVWVAVQNSSFPATALIAVDQSGYAYPIMSHNQTSKCYAAKKCSDPIYYRTER